MTPQVLRRLADVAFAACALLLLATVVGQILIARELDVSVLAAPAGELGLLPFAVLIFTFPLVGFLIARRQPSNVIGWVLLGIGLVWGIRGFLFDIYLRWTLTVQPGSLPAADYVGALAFPLWVPMVGVIGTFLILLFPDGHPPSPRWRPVARACGIIIVGLYISGVVRPGPVQQAPVGNLRNPFAIDALTPIRPVLDALAMLLPLSILVCALALVLRFRRSRGVERLQLKWLATAGAFVACGYLFLMVSSAIAGGTNAGPTPRWFDIFTETLFLSFGLIPVAIGVAVLKHGLYGIDVVINKALVFGTLAAFITGVYVAIVVGVGTLVGQGNDSLALSIAATAIVAVGFQPARERVQRMANRLVYGARSTPYEVLSDFADRMGGAYGPADPLPRMARTVAEGLGAARVDVWLNVGDHLVPEAVWPAREGPGPSGVPILDGVLPALAGDRVVQVRHRGELLGAISVTKAPGEPVTPTEDKLLTDVAAQAGLVLRNVRLIEELRGSRERLVRTQDTERRRLERNLHDGAQQSLVSVALIVRMARERVSAEHDEIARALDLAGEQLSTAIGELRELARGIHPAILTERGLVPALTSLAERSRIPVTIDSSLTDRLPPTIEGTVYFVVAEALTNVTKYAHATAVTISVERANGELITTITDDGIGGADPAKGSGLTGLADRIAAVEGHLDLLSPPAGGTRLECRIPVHLPPQSTSAAPIAVGGTR